MLSSLYQPCILHERKRTGGKLFFPSGVFLYADVQSDSSLLLGDGGLEAGFQQNNFSQLLTRSPLVSK